MASIIDKIKEVFINPFVSSGDPEIDEIARINPLVRSRVRSAVREGKPLIKEKLYKGTEFARKHRQQEKSHALRNARWANANKVEHIYIYEAGDPPDNSVDCQYFIGDIKSLRYWSSCFGKELKGDKFVKDRRVWDTADQKTQQLIPCTCKLREIGEFHWSDQTFRWIDKSYLGREVERERLITQWELDFTK